MCLYTKNAWLSDLAVALFAAAIIAIQVAASATKVLATVSQNINNVFVTDILVLLDSINSYSWGEEHSAQKKNYPGDSCRDVFVAHLEKRERRRDIAEALLKENGSRWSQQRFERCMPVKEEPTEAQSDQQEQEHKKRSMRTASDTEGLLRKSHTSRTLYAFFQRRQPPFTVDIAEGRFKKLLSSHEVTYETKLSYI